MPADADALGRPKDYATGALMHTHIVLTPRYDWQHARALASIDGAGAAWR